MTNCTPAGPMLILNPAVRVLWRAADRVQLELGTRALVVDGLPASMIAALAGDGLSAEYAAPHRHALLLLREHGFVWDRPAAAALLPTPRLAADLAALRVRFGSRADAVLASRRRATVVVHGAGRLTVAVATLLAGAGVGHVALPDSGDVRRSDTAPGGLTERDEGRRFADAARDAIHRCAPDVDTGPFTPAVDLAVLAGDGPVEPELRDRLHERRYAHLVASAAGDRAVVGPLVIPGLSSCTRCADLHRIDRDAAWSALAVQLSIAPRLPAPSDMGLTALAAGLASVHALAYLDGDEPATLDSTLELHLPDWRLRRRTWTMHAACDCAEP